MDYVLFADLLHLGIVLDVVVAIRKAKAAGRGKGDHTLGVFEVLVGFEAEQGFRALQLLARHQRGQGPDRAQMRDGIEVRLKRESLGLLDGAFVHAGVEVVPNLLLDGAASLGLLGRLIEDAPQKQLVVVGELRVDVPVRLVRRDGVLLDPCAAGVVEEVRAGVDRAVHGSRIQARRVGEPGKGRGSLRQQYRCKAKSDKGFHDIKFGTVYSFTDF